MANERARHLRRNATNAERALWRFLRIGKLDGHTFPRQHPLGPYTVHFVCLEQKPVLEVDGATHGGSDEIERDIARTAWLEGRGYRVMRCHNDDVYRNMEGVVLTILEALHATN